MLIQILCERTKLETNLLRNIVLFGWQKEKHCSKKKMLPMQILPNFDFYYPLL